MNNGFADRRGSTRFGIDDTATPDGVVSVLWFGPHRLAVADVIAVEAVQTHDRPIWGLLLGAGVFVVLSIGLTALVVDQGWRPRYLIAAGFLALLALAGFAEILKSQPQAFYEVKIHMRSSAVVTFASADQAEVAAFLALLERARATRA